VAGLSVYIRAIRGWVDLECILYIFALFYYLCPDWPHQFCEDYLPARRGSAIPPNIGVYIYIYKIYI